MSFLQLPAASRRLRQAAKAHAAGEIAREDYRRMRREIISELHVEFAAGSGAVDAFSLGPDSTRRRGEPSAATELPTPPAQPVAVRAGNRRNIVVAVFVFVSVFALFVTSAASAAPGSIIPAVRDRDPNPQNSMVLPITGLRVEALTPAPEVSEAELAEQVDAWFAEAKTAALDVGSSGFSESELNEVGSLLNRLGVHDSGGLDTAALAALNALAARQKKRRQVTLEQLERIAERVQGYYRGRGYLAARAYVPAQTLADDRALLHVLPGQLESVVTESTTKLAVLAAAAFEPQLGAAANERSLEQVLYKLNSLAGVKASGGLRAGTEVGGTSLDLQLSNPSRLVGGVYVDNHGDKRSAKYRLRGLLDWQNPLGRGDMAQVELAQRYHSERATGLSVSYRTPTHRLGDVASISYVLNDFSADARTGDVDGLSSTFRFGLERQLFGQRDRSLAVGLGGALQRLELAEIDQKLWWIEPQVSAHRVFDESRWVVRGNASVLAGKLGDEKYTGQSSSFALVRGELTAWRPFAGQELQMHLSGQLGTDDLPDSLKQTMGGNRRLTAIRPGSFLTDSSVVMGLEMSATPARWKPFGTLAFYTRVGSGNREAGESGMSAFAWEGGLVWRLPQRSPFTGEIRLGVPLSEDGINESGDEDARLLLSLGWRS